MAQKNHKKNHYQGSKMRGKHTTLTDFAAEIVSSADKIPEVTGIRSGFMKSGLRPSSTKRIKVIDQGDDVLLLKIRSGTSIQEVILYCSDAEKVRNVFEQQM